MLKICLRVSLAVLALLASPPLAAHGEIEAVSGHEAIKTGPHGGKLLLHGPLSLEVTMFEKNSPPHWRVYVVDSDETINPRQVQLKMTLTRFNGREETIHFIPMEDFLQSRQAIDEPHSFDVHVILTYQGKHYQWQYADYEGRLTLSDDMMKAVGIKTAIAKGRLIDRQLTVVGKIVANRDAMAPIYPRYAGIVQSVYKNLGDDVKEGDRLAVVESNESLQDYTITAPISGTIVKKAVTVGEMVKIDNPIFEIANLDSVWADLTLYRKEAPLVKKGMNVIVSSDGGKPRMVSKISYISPLGIEDSQTVLARAVLANADMKWLPGMYVNAKITVSTRQAAVAVPLKAIQRWHDQPVVFVKRGNQFEATPVKLGDQNNHWAEILAGLEPGDEYVVQNSFFLKADLDKSGFGHEH
ncbi:efflux RND transporter periplasmic adaptor subunit [Legionella taurinensis]|uniref:Cation transporter n=1 Tax=Legionella taurinensis TaxID=70611 RepID=A0AB38N4M7_9GAMM|nr:efflux RND transporter periplasmic adaptor subunit [Legionella taurinensis]MDX1837966.1 efflux RND transporter periplasmic adaptor subunit [Legionella taurinensis]PUT39444.1 cation transporter [Legionella taurinensis]PUT41753.1 cation transporter [Legionella taurinensis]PUT44587.1 cation transporter [Legionella taurinensis]PUT46831.1 cation transporter [Legionella taurinensis]